MLWLLPAFAGDPCPISLQLVEYTPSWRDRDADLAGLKSKRTLYGINYRKRGEAVTIQRVVPNTRAAALLTPGDQVSAIDGNAVSSVSDIDRALTGKPAMFRIVRDGVEKTVQIPPSRFDPLLLALFERAKQAECRDVSFRAIEQPQELEKAIFDTDRGFRCTDAHKGLPKSHDGTLISVRGGRRVLLTMPGWATACIALDDSDGPALDAATVDDLLERLTSSYVKDRHANP